MDTLPASATPSRGHDLPFPFNVRRGLGLWKLRYLPPGPTANGPPASDPVERGRYLVQGPAHCGACHTPRDPFGGEIAERILEVAREHGVPLREDRELVGVLAQIDLGDEIPTALYVAVAEVLAFAYRLSGKLPPESRDRHISG